jgi:hypothetical protein
MKKIIICGYDYYTEAVLKAIEEAAKKFNLPMPEVTCEIEESKNLIEIAKTDQFPLFILDKRLPSKEGYPYKEAMPFSEELRRQRGEKYSVYHNPRGNEAGILIYTKEKYSFSERNSGSFWRANMYLVKDEDATDEQLAELVLGAAVFADKEWQLNALWDEIRSTFKRRAA